MQVLSAEAQKQLRSRVSAMDRDFQDFKDHALEIQDYLLPWSGYGLSGDNDKETTDGTKKHSYIFDSAPEDAVDVAAAGLQSGMTSPGRPWFRLGTEDPDMGRREEIKLWLYEVERRIYAVLQRSNAYSAFFNTYKEMLGFGTGAMAMLESQRYAVRCRPFTFGEYRLGQDSDYQVDTFYRAITMTVSQIVHEFGWDNVPQVVKNMYQNGQLEERRRVEHLIEMNDDRFEVKGAKGKPWRAVYWMMADSSLDVLDVRGYHEFPVLAPCWYKIGNKTYGYGPGMKALADIKGLYKITEKGYVGLDKTIDPPLIGSEDLQDKLINTIPGGLNFTNTLINQGGLRSLYDLRIPFQELTLWQQKITEAIRRNFYNDMFLMISNLPSTSNRTATEILERHQEKLLQLGPIVEGVQKDLLRPAIDRIYGILLRGEALPPPPRDLLGQELRIEYISILAQAQKAIGTAAIRETVAFAGSMAEAYPDILDNIDPDKTLQSFSESIGSPAVMFRTEDEREELREQRAQRVAQQQAMDQAQQAAQSAELMSKTDLNKGSALDAMLGTPR